MLTKCFTCPKIQGRGCPLILITEVREWECRFAASGPRNQRGVQSGDHVVFGAHVDENMGNRVQIIVLGATDLEAGVKADVAPVADQVIMAKPKSKQSHASKLKSKPIADSTTKGSKKTRTGKKDQVDQNTFEFMEEQNQRGSSMTCLRETSRRRRFMCPHTFAEV